MARRISFWAASVVVGLAGIGGTVIRGEDIPAGPSQAIPGAAATTPQIDPAITSLPGGSMFADAGRYYPKSRWFADYTAPYQFHLTYGQGLYRPWIYQPNLAFWYPHRFASATSSPYWFYGASYNYSPPYNSGAFEALYSQHGWEYYPGATEYDGYRYTGRRTSVPGPFSRGGGGYYW